MLARHRHQKRFVTLLPIALVAAAGFLLSCESCGESPPAGDDAAVVVTDAAVDGGAGVDAAIDGGVEDAAGDSGQEAVPIDPVTGQETQTFAFLGESDALSSALTDAFDAYVTAPTDEASMVQLFVRRKSAMQYLAAHADEAAAKILGELNGRNPLDERAWRIGFHLLGLFESQAGIDFLSAQAALAVTPGSDPQDSPFDPVSVQGRLRRAAVHALGGIAVRGSATARGKLLDLVGTAGRLDVKAEAIKAFYAASPSRSKAKDLLMAKLQPGERYLVHETF